MSELADPHAFTDRQWGAYFHGPDRHAADLAAIGSRGYSRPLEHGRDDWVDGMVHAHGSELAELAHASRDITGTTLLHNDVRPDNLLMDRSGRVVLLDWNWVCLGPAWVDFLGLLPLAHRQGIAIQQWVTRPLFAGADSEELDQVLAALSVKMLGGHDQELAPGLPEAVWAHKLLFAHDTLRLLADRRGWTAP